MNPFLPLADAPPSLRAFRAAHAAELERLGVGHFTHYREERPRDGFSKYILGQMDDGRWAMLHHFTTPDPDPTPHSHPCEFESTLLVGGYAERVFWSVGGRWHSRIQHWWVGRRHIIPANLIHCVERLRGAECWTLCFAGPVVAEVRHYLEALAAHRHPVTA